MPPSRAAQWAEQELQARQEIRELLGAVRGSVKELGAALDKLVALKATQGPDLEAVLTIVRPEVELFGGLVSSSSRNRVQPSAPLGSEA